MSDRSVSDIENSEIEFPEGLKSIVDDVIQIQGRSMSIPTLSDSDFKNKIVSAWITL